MTTRRDFTNSDEIAYFGGKMKVCDELQLPASHGAQLAIKSNTVEVSCSGATSSATDLFPAGALALGVTTVVSTALTGATGWKVGDGTDADHWGDKTATAKGSATGAADTASGATPLMFCAAATSVVLTANGSNFTGGKIRVTGYYIELTSLVS
jgi:hypothetical protein